MLFFLNLDGTVTRSDTDHVYQGQNKVANVELFTLISPAQAAIQVAFTLPNGLTTTYAPMSYVGAYSVDESNQKQVHRWKLALPYNVTEVEGQVGVSFNVLLNDGTSGETQETINQTTYTSSFLVEYSALPIPSTTATEDELGQLLDLLNLYYAQNASLAAKQPFVVGTVKTNTLGADQQASVAVEQSTTPDSRGNYPTNFTFSIPQGIQGEIGETPDVSAVAEVNNTVGTPSVVVEKSGTKENPVFNFKFSNVKGQTGDSGIGDAKLSNTPGTSETDGYTKNAVNGIVQNPNLLINPNFAINQRGQTSYSGAVYGVDRWKGIGGAITATPVANGIKLSSSGTSNIYIKQIVETNLAGKTVTASCKLSAINSGEGGRFAVYYSTDGSSWTLISGMTIATAGISKLTVTIPANAVYVSVDIGVRPSSDVVFEWAKLEIGSVATEFSPPDNATELLKCQRYYIDIGRNNSTSYLIGSGVFFSATLAYVAIPIPTTLRTAPTLILGDLSRLTLLGDNKSYTPTEVALLGINNNAVTLRYNITGATAGNGCAARLVNAADNMGILAFDAEI
nr:MAG TPA: tail fiber protein [Caudoviricetes sp.]